MYPHLIAVIFRSDGMEDSGVFSIAFSKPFPKEAIGPSIPAVAPAANAFLKNERRLVDFVMLGRFKFILPCAGFQELLNLFFGNGQFTKVVV